MGVTATCATVAFFGVFCRRLDFLGLASGVFIFVHIGLEALGFDFWGVAWSREDFLGLASTDRVLVNQLGLRGLSSGAATWFKVLFFWGVSALQFSSGP